MFNIITKEKTVAVFQKALKETEKKLCVNSQVTFEKFAKRYDIILTLIIMEIRMLSSRQLLANVRPSKTIAKIELEKN